jgi:DNA-binding NarL/FixJ family response regulator
MTIRIVLADDQPLLRQGFRLILSAQPDMEVIGEAGDGRAAVALTQAHQPDIVLMDVRMPHMDGIEATRRISADHPHSRVIILTTFDLDEYVFAGLRAGASGFLLKDVEPADLLASIRSVARGDAVIAPRMTRRLLDTFAQQLPAGTSGTEQPSAADGLTEREREVYLAIADGLNNSEIAARLNLAEATVKTYVGRILTKLDLRDRIHIVISAYQTGDVR